MQGKKTDNKKQKAIRQSDSDQSTTSVSDFDMTLNDSSDLSLTDIVNVNESDPDENAEAMKELKEKEIAVERKRKETNADKNESKNRCSENKIKNDNKMRKNSSNDALKLPKLTTESVDKYYATLYTSPALTYFWGKVKKTFEDEEDGDVERVEMDFLHKKDIGSNPDNWTWVHKSNTKDISIVQKQFVFYGPVYPEINKGKFTFPDKEVKKFLFEDLKDKIDC